MERKSDETEAVERKSDETEAVERKSDEAEAVEAREEMEVPRREAPLANSRKFYLEASKLYADQAQTQTSNMGWMTILALSVQCIGVVYGDIGTSPLYVLPGIFPEGIQDNEDILSALSLIFYSIVVIGLVKYVLIVLSANDNGDGGTFALYSLICRHTKASLLPDQLDAGDGQVSLSEEASSRLSFVENALENKQIPKCVLLFVTLLGTSMVLGDGILTPCISVLSAVSGIKLAASSLTDGIVMWISVVILILLFQVQRFGTRRVGYSFSPILVLWFVCIGLIGIYNFFTHDPSVIKVLNPFYMVKFFKKDFKDAWISLGGIILCITGAEALFADLGHFHVRSIQISSCCLVFPSVLLAYFGQASYLRNHNDAVSAAFYLSIPKPLYWPVFVFAVMASVIASQSLISAAFAIVKQSMALGCFPRVKVVHTSNEQEGQVYIPEINTILMLACVGVTLGFKDSMQIGNAYGTAVAFVFLITSALLVLVMIIIWKVNVLWIILYLWTIGVIEVLFLSSTLYKFTGGGYLPLLFAAVVVTIMSIWSYGYRMTYTYELKNEVSVKQLEEIVSSDRIRQVPGIVLFHTHVVPGIPPIFSEYISKVPLLHSVLVFISIKTLAINRVPRRERFLFQRVEVPGLLVYRCVAIYGYSDARMDQEEFQGMLLENLEEYVQKKDLESGSDEMQDDAERIHEALSNGAVHMMGETVLRAAPGSAFAKRFLITLFNWLNKCVRCPEEAFKIPRSRLLKVGIAYEI